MTKNKTVKITKKELLGRIEALDEKTNTTQIALNKLVMGCVHIDPFLTEVRRIDALSVKVDSMFNSPEMNLIRKANEEANRCIGEYKNRISDMRKDNQELKIEIARLKNERAEMVELANNHAEVLSERNTLKLESEKLNRLVAELRQQVAFLDQTVASRNSLDEKVAELR